MNEEQLSDLVSNKVAVKSHGALDGEEHFIVTMFLTRDELDKLEHILIHRDTFSLWTRVCVAMKKLGL